MVTRLCLNGIREGFRLFDGQGLVGVFTWIIGVPDQPPGTICVRRAYVWSRASIVVPGSLVIEPGGQSQCRRIIQ